MGAAKNAKLEARDRKRSRQRFMQHGGIADFGSVDADLLRRAIATVSLSGGALRFGYTRDGGAYAIGVYSDGNHETDFLRPSDSIEDYLRGLIEDFGEDTQRSSDAAE